MSIGNLRDQGNKGNNFPYQLRSLQLLGDISGFVGGGATEATLLQVLNSIQNGQEYEAMLISDAASNTFLEVRVWNTDTHTFEAPVYYTPGGTTPYTVGQPGGPVAPITYINGNTLLATIASNTLGVYNNSVSKMNRIKGADDYTRTFTYTGGGDVDTITHTGTTLLGSETILETFNYSGGNVSSIVYS